jgi:Uma2 family endonuclease
MALSAYNGVSSTRAREQAMDANARRMTAEELLCLPDDGLRHELVAGELRTMAPGGGEHGWVTSRPVRGLFADE